MGYAIALNLLIIAFLSAALYLTSNPLVLFGLLLLKELPYGLLVPEDDEEEGKPMGFVHPEK